MRTLVLLACLFCTPLYAQQVIRQMPVVCAHVLDFAASMEEFGEEPMLRGESVRMTEQNPTVNIMVLFLNSQTRSWSLAEKVSEEVVCVMAVGEKLEPLDREDNSLEEPKSFQGVLFRKELRKEGFIK